MAFAAASLLVYWGAGVLFTAKDPYGGFILIAVMLAGSLLYINYRDKNRADLRSGAWTIAYLVFTLVMLELGEYRLKLIPLPWDWLADVIGALGFYLWALKTALPADEVKNRIESAMARADSAE